MKKIIILSCSVILLASCFDRKLNKSFTYSDLETPPGTVKVKDNFYVDASEIRNIDYLEFLHWTARTFSLESNEYKSALPDTTVWTNNKYWYNQPYVNYYLRHSAYRNYPVVGISYEQAQAFCKWRSDRVMEFMLIREGILTENKKPTKENYFTIEKYLKGQFGKVVLEYYPQYSLIDTATYLKILPFADSINNERIKHSRHKEEMALLLQPWCKDNKTALATGDATIPVTFKKRNAGFIYNLKGNVRELTAEQNFSFGGSFIDSCKTVMNTNFYPNKEANCYTGFRCMCRYKKWEVGNSKRNL